MKANAEGEMPDWPVPSTWRSALDLNNEGVTLYGNNVSPPCRKIKTIFKFYGIKYTQLSSKPDSEYKKIPIVTIGKYQINDSHIIARILAQVLEGNDLTERELLIEQTTTRGLMMALEVSVMESIHAIQQCAPHISENLCLQGLVWSVACCIPCCGLSNRIKSKFPDLKSVPSYGKWYAEQLGDQPFFHGETIGIIDCAVYGVLGGFAVAGNLCFDEFVGADVRLKSWWQKCTVQVDQK